MLVVDTVRWLLAIHAFLSFLVYLLEEQLKTERTKAF